MSPGTWCCTSGGMAADSESRDMPYHIQYIPQVSCKGSYLEVTPDTDLDSISILCFR